MKAIVANLVGAASQEDRRRTKAWSRRLTASAALPLSVAAHAWRWAAQTPEAVHG